MRVRVEKCVECGRCVSYCPVGAIQLFQDEQNLRYKSLNLLFY